MGLNKDNRGKTAENVGEIPGFLVKKWWNYDKLSA